MASKILDDQSESSHAKGRVIDLSKMGQQSGSMKAEGTWTKGVRNQVMAVWPHRILIYLLGHFGPWNWNLIFLLPPIGRVSQIDWSKNGQVTNCFFLALFGKHLHPRNVYFPSNVSLWQILPRSPMPSLHFQHLETNDLQHLCAAMWKNTPNTSALLMVKGQFFSRHAPFISKALKAPSR